MVYPCFGWCWSPFGSTCARAARRLLALSRGLGLPIPKPFRAPFIPGITVRPKGDCRGAWPLLTPLAHGCRYWFLTMERPSWRRRPSKSWSLLSIIIQPPEMGAVPVISGWICRWTDLSINMYQLWVQIVWSTTLSASILSIKVHTILANFAMSWLLILMVNFDHTSVEMSI